MTRQRHAAADGWTAFETQAIHDPIETDDTWINGRSCEDISAESSSVGENDETNYDNRRIACGMVAQVNAHIHHMVLGEAVRAPAPLEAIPRQ